MPAVELAEAYVSLIPSAQGITSNIEKALTAPAARAGKTAGAAASKNIGAGVVDGFKATTRLMGGVGKDVVAALNLSGNLQKEGQGVQRTARDLGASFSAGFKDATAAASSFTGTLGTLGGVTRKTADVMARPGQNFVAGFSDAKAASSAFTGTLGTLGGAARKTADVLARPGQNFVAGFSDASAASSSFTGVLGTLGGAARKTADVLATPAQNFIAGARSSQAAASSFTGTMGTLGGAATRVGGTIAGAWGKATAGLSPLRGGISNLVGGMKSADTAASDTSGRLGTLGGVVGQVTGRFAAFHRDATSAASQVAGGVKSMTGSFVSFGVKAGLALGGVATAIGGLAAAGGLNRALQIENAQAKLKGLGNSAADVDLIMQNATASVKGTSFGLNEAASTAAAAVAAGIQPGEKLQDVLTTVSNSAAIAGTDMTSMGSIFNKVAATGKLQGDELLQLSDAGVPALSFLAKETGKTSAEVSDMVSKGQIDFDTFASAMKHGVGDAAFEMGKTTSGSFANMKAAISRLGADAIQPFLPLARGFFGVITAGTDKLAKVTGPAFEALAGKVTAFGQALGSIGDAGALTPDIVEKMGLAPDSPLGRGLVELIGGVRAFGAAWTAMDGDITSSGFPGFMEQVAYKVHSTIDALTGLASSAPTQAIGGLVAAITPLAAGLAGVALQAVKLPGIFGPLGGVITKLGGALRFLGGPWGLVISLISTAIAQSPQLQSIIGGIIGQLGQFAGALGGALMPIFQQVAGYIPTVVGLFGMIVAAVGQVLGAVLPLVATLIGQLAPVFVSLVSAILPPLVQVLGTVITALLAVLPPIMQIVTAIVTYLAPVITTIISALAAGIQILSGPLGTVLGVVAGAIIAVTVAMWAWTAATTALSVASGILAGIWAVITSPITLVVAAIALVVGAFVLAYQKIGWFHTGVTAIWQALVASAQWVGSMFGTVFTALGTVLTWVWQSILVPFGTFVGTIFSGFFTYLTTTVFPALSLAVQAVGGFFTWLWQAVIVPAWNGIQAAISFAWNSIIMPIFNAINAFITTVLAPVFQWLYTTIIQPVWTLIAWAIQAAWTIIVNIFQALNAFITQVLAPTFQWFYASVIAPVWDWISAKITAVVNWVWNSILAPLIGWISGFFSAAWRTMSSLIGYVWDWVSSKINAVVNWIRDSILSPLMSWVNTVFIGGWRLFSNLLGGIWDWVSNKINAVVNWIRGSILSPLMSWVNTVFIGGWHAFKDSLGRVWDWVSNKIHGTVEWIRGSVLKPLSDWIQGPFVKAWEATQKGIGTAWDKLKDAVKTPIKFVVDTVINGFVRGFNKINNFWHGDDMDELKLGFATGGYTGPGAKYTPAGVVHADEFVVKKASRRKFERENPGVLDHINATGELPDKPPAHPTGAPAGAVYAGVPHGPGTSVWGNLQVSAAKAGHFYVPDTNVLGASTRKAAQAWMGRSALDIRMGNGRPGITDFGTGGAGGWGYYSGTSIRMQPSVPADRRLGVLVHEIGHALGLDHVAPGDSTSVMDHNMTGGNWPHQKDYDALVDLYGKPGAGVKTYGEPASDGGLSWIGQKIQDWIDENLEGLRKTAEDKFNGNKFVGVPLGMVQTMVDGVMSMFAGSGDGSPTASSGGSGKVREWMTKALKISGDYTEGNLNAGVARAMQESGGDPNAVNNWDSNARNGDPSRGLMQVIGSTFRANQWPGHGNILDPIDNILASINYTKRTYGSLIAGWTRAGGYAGGGLVTAPTLFDGGGWLENTGRAQLVQHKRSRPDAVLTNQQWAHVRSLAEQVDQSGAGTRVENYLTVQERPERSIEHMSQRLFETAAHEMRKAGVLA